jgi:hypothetical protein
MTLLAIARWPGTSGRVKQMDEQTYFDTDGNKRSLNWMTRNEPEWAANVIRNLKEKNCSLKSVVADLVDLMARSDMEEFGEDCQPVTNGEWFPAIERAKAAIA